MTLFKQIALMIASMFLILFLIIVLTDLSRTGNFQQGQLRTTAKDMATTLGIAISNLPSEADPAALEVLFNAVFDSGHYTSIKLTGVDGLTIHQKAQKLDIEGVPDWFIRMVSLEPALGSTVVMKGWTQLGELKLEVHPGFAYTNIYQALVSALRWFSLLFFLSMFVLWLVLRHLLQPLQRVKEQADAIHSNRFVQLSKMPATTELKRVVEAMNLMVSKVQSIFDEQEKTLSNYQKLLYQDKMTELGNRHYLLDRLQQSTTADTGQTRCMAIIKIQNFNLLRDQRGYEASDNLVKILADLLRLPHANLEAECASRFNEDEFAFLSAADYSDVVDYMQAFFSQVKTLLLDSPDLEDVKLLAGICTLESDEETGDVLSGLDYCLSLAENRGPFSIEQRSPNNLDLPQGKQQWRNWLEAVLENRQLFLVGQFAFNSDQVPQQRELFVRARNQQGEILTAAAFMPMASSLDMAHEIDKEVFRLVLSKQNLGREIPLALNLSAAFFEKAETQAEIAQLLAECEQNGSRLCLEASHNILNQHPIMCAQLSARVRRHRHLFGIDNFDLTQSIQLLLSGQFDYVKINAKTLQAMNRSDIPASFQALRTLTETVAVEVIAVGVDSQQMCDELRGLGIDILQGNFLGSPEVV